LVAAGESALSEHWRNSAQQVAVVQWPTTVEESALTFLTDNLLAPRFASDRHLLKYLHRPYRGVSTVMGLPWPERDAFLADRPAFPPEPPQAFAEAVDLEDLVADFGRGLIAWRRAEWPCDWLLTR
jgi:hypothetical protein